MRLRLKIILSLVPLLVFWRRHAYSRLRRPSLALCGGLLAHFLRSRLESA